MPHQERGVRGKHKGRFIKKKTKDNIEKLVAASKEGKRKKIDAQENQATPEGKQRKYIKLNGCRVLDVKKAGQDMWCSSCDLPLSFCHVVEEELHGLASILRVHCQKCDRIIDVHTSEMADTYHDVNLELAAALLETGIGPTQLNTWLSSVDLPAVSEDLIESYKKHVEQSAEISAKESCSNSMQQEIESTSEAQDD